jgi:hypothetical protein
MARSTIRSKARHIWRRRSSCSGTRGLRRGGPGRPGARSRCAPAGSHRDADVVVDDLAVVAVPAPDRTPRKMFTPGVSVGTMIWVILPLRSAGPSGSSVRHMTMKKSAAMAVRGEPLVAVDDPLVAVPSSRGLQRPGVGAGLIRLGHGEAGLQLALESGASATAASAPRCRTSPGSSGCPSSVPRHRRATPPPWRRPAPRSCRPCCRKLSRRRRTPRAGAVPTSRPA